MAHMDEDMYYPWNDQEGSDVDNWEVEQVFQDREGQEEEEEEPEYEPREDFGFFGEMGMMED